MPVIHISGNNNISIEKKREMVEKVSQIVADAYGLPIETITVLVQGYEMDDIGAGGVLLSDRKQE